VTDRARKRRLNTIPPRCSPVRAALRYDPPLGRTKSTEAVLALGTTTACVSAGATQIAASIASN